MRDIESALRTELRDPEYSEGYAESFLNSYIATQIKVIREQRTMTQAELGSHIGTTQAGVSRYENVNYSSWNIKTLIRLARAFHVRLKVSFEPFGTLPEEAVRFDRKTLERVSREEDPGLQHSTDEKIEIIEELLGKYLARKVVPIDLHRNPWAGPAKLDTSQDIPGGVDAASSGL
jgi:transcriptional regulator with XRE-family HTH domain